MSPYPKFISSKVATLGSGICSPTDLIPRWLPSPSLPPLVVAPWFPFPSCGVSEWSCLGLSGVGLSCLRCVQLVELTSLRFVERRKGSWEMVGVVVVHLVTLEGGSVLDCRVPLEKGLFLVPKASP